MVAVFFVARYGMHIEMHGYVFVDVSEHGRYEVYGVVPAPALVRCAVCFEAVYVVGGNVDPDE
jgi:hypothetical protein